MTFDMHWTEYSVKRINQERAASLREELFAFLQAFLPLLGGQALQARPACIKHRPGRQPQSYKIVPILSGEDEIVLPAIEAPAQQRAAIIDRASRSAKVHALAVRLGGEKKHRISRR